jgi:hypothetical protein
MDTVKGGVDLLISPKFRQWLYGVTVVAVPLLVIYGVVSSEDAALWVAMAAAILGQGTAFTALAQQRKAGRLDQPATQAGPTQ